jgi:hypothetical protein
MVEYDCATVSIEKKERLSPPSTKIHEDFEYLIFTPELRRIAATTILAFATYTAPFGHLEVAPTVTPPTSTMIMEVDGDKSKRSISLSEARRFAREIQNRIDAQYQSLLEAEAKTSAVWEEDV